MNDNSTPEVVTEDEAINKVKRWVEEMDWEKAIEGCKEILEVDPANEEIRTLLIQAEKGLAERPTEAVAPVETVVKAAAEMAAPTETPATTPPPQQPAQATTPAAPTAGASEVSSMEGAPATEAKPKSAPLPQRKSKSTVMIAGILGFLILALLIIALVFGWLNPVFDWIFGLIG